MSEPLPGLDPAPWPLVAESVHTAPHAAAPAPGWWHAPDSDSTEHEVTVLLYGLVRALQPDLAVETGAAFGYSSYAIGLALRANRHGHLVTLEVDPARAAVAADRCLGLPVQVLAESSLDYSPPAALGFAFYDSLYELRAAEFRRHLGLGVLRAGTVVAFHDWTSGLRGHYADVHAEVELLDRAGLLRPVYLPTPRGLAICEVLG